MPRQHSPVFFFDMTRHRSHLFFRYVGTHPDVFDLWHPYLQAAIFGPERVTQYTKNIGLDGQETEWAPASGTETYADAIRKFLDAVKDAEHQNKLFVANEHTQLTFKQDIILAWIRKDGFTIPKVSNPTVIPDHIFSSLTPVFVIRNPIYAVPSNYISFRQTSQVRPGGEDWKQINGIPLQRQLFDYFRDRDGGKSPIVVDGDDVIWRTDELRDSLSQALGLDPKGLSSAWEAVPQDKRSENEVIRYFLQAIDDSTGIIYPSEQRPVADLRKAYHNWLEEYGQEVADQLQATAEENMPHYEYMAQFKI